jgi:hypothetical protein
MPGTRSMRVPGTVVTGKNHASFDDSRNFLAAITPVA